LTAAECEHRKSPRGKMPPPTQLPPPVERQQLSDEEEEDTCPICMHPFFDLSVQCPNSHRFCMGCLRTLHGMSHNRTRLIACPLCRIGIDPALIDPGLSPPTGGAILVLRIGNTHEENTDRHNPHRWMCYVDVVSLITNEQEDGAIGRQPRAETLIHSVDFNLHPTFKPRRVSCSAPRQCLAQASVDRIEERRRFSSGSKNGWGMFEVDVQLRLRGGGKRIQFWHMLSFEGDGSLAEQEHRVPLSAGAFRAAREEVDSLERLSRPRAAGVRSVSNGRRDGVWTP
jgi:hypothetical protein